MGEDVSHQISVPKDTLWALASVDSRAQGCIWVRWKTHRAVADPHRCLSSLPSSSEISLHLPCVIFPSQPHELTPGADLFRGQLLCRGTVRSGTSNLGHDWSTLGKVKLESF